MAELTALGAANIDSQRMVIHVRRTKSRHDRIVPLSPRMLQALREYWKARRPQGAYLFGCSSRIAREELSDSDRLQLRA